MDTDTIELPLTGVIRNLGLYPRTYVDEYTVERLIDALNAGEILPPLLVNQRYWLIDGFHRWAAYEKAGITEVKAQRVETLSDADFFRRAVEANTAHGKPIGRNDYQHIILTAAKLGLEPVVIAAALRVPAVRLTDLKRITPSANGNGDKPSEDINLSESHLGTGYPQHRGPDPKGKGAWSKFTFYAETLRDAIEGGQIDWNRPKLVAALDRLYEALAMAERQ